MSGFVETHRSYVNTWECDDNDHLNVQFYFKRFDEAARLFVAGMGGNVADPLPRTRHVRFHSELHAGGITTMRSAIISGGRHDGYAVHLLENLETGRIAATALDAPSGLAPSGNVVEADKVAMALPRGVGLAPAVPLPPDAVIDRGGIVSNRTIVQPGQCDAAGELLSQNYVARLSDAAAHVWEASGVGIARLRELGYGRVALEMKLTHQAPPRAGEAVLIHSFAWPTGAKTMMLHHEMTRLSDGTPLATAEVVAVIVDLKTRRSVEIPTSRSADG